MGVAEEACQFEHRDLHWGNLLIKRGAPATAAFRFRCRDTSLACFKLLRQALPQALLVAHAAGRLHQSCGT